MKTLKKSTEDLLSMLFLRLSLGLIEVAIFIEVFKINYVWGIATLIIILYINTFKLS